MVNSLGLLYYLRNKNEQKTRKAAGLFSRQRVGITRHSRNPHTYRWYDSGADYPDFRRC